MPDLPIYLSHFPHKLDRTLHLQLVADSRRALAESEHLLQRLPEYSGAVIPPEKRTELKE